MNIDFTEGNQEFDIFKFKEPSIKELTNFSAIKADELGIGFLPYYSASPLKSDHNFIKIEFADFTLKLYDAVGSMEDRRKFKYVYVEMKREVRAEYLRQISEFALEVYRFIAGKIFIVEQK